MSSTSSSSVESISEGRGIGKSSPCLSIVNIGPGSGELLDKNIRDVLPSGEKVEKRALQARRNAQVFHELSVSPIVLSVGIEVGELQGDDPSLQTL